MAKSIIRRGLTAAITVAALCMPAAAGAAIYPAGFAEQTVASGLTQPVAVDWAPDGTAYIAQKPGQLMRVPPGGGSATEVLDISDRVNAYSDRGFTGLALDRDFDAGGGYVYLGYVYELKPLMADSPDPMVSRVTRIKVLSDGTLENPQDPETPILGKYVDGPCPEAPPDSDCVPADADSHLIGTVRSAADDTLWVGSGDGASYAEFADPQRMRSLDENSLAGKIMHVDEETGAGLPGHPFCTAETDLSRPCTKVHAKGFRNPFRFHIRPDGRISVGDVGMNSHEEIDLVDGPGGSYGWPCYEGPARNSLHQDTASCQPYYAGEGTSQAERPPAHSYPHGAERGSVIAGPTYTSDEYPVGYRGAMFYGDFSKRQLTRLSFDSQDRPTTSVFATDFFATDLEIGPGGDLYYTDVGDFQFESGTLRRVVYSAGNAAPVAVADASPRNGAVQVQFDGDDSSDADGDELTYDWDFGDGTPHSAQPNPAHSYGGPGPYTASLTVHDGRGKSDTDEIVITPGSTAPVVEIETPLDGSSYRDGDTIELLGSATNADEGELAESSLRWQANLRHGAHFHAVASPTGAEASFVTLRDHDADSDYRIILTARDSFGVEGEDSVVIRPETVTARISSQPAGAQIAYGSGSEQAPYVRQTAVGHRTSVSASETLFAGGREYRFVAWSDGGERLHDLTVPESDFDLVARYEPVRLAPTAPTPALDPPSENGDTKRLGYRQTVLSTRGLVSLYGLGDPGRFAREARGGARGTLLGAPRLVASLVASLSDGGARTFDGDDDAVALPQTALGTPRALSVEAWARPRARGQGRRTRRYLFSAARNIGVDGFGLLLGRDGHVKAVASQALGERGVATGPVLRRGRTHHLVATYDGTRLRIYVNGRLRADRGYGGGIRWRRDRKPMLADSSLGGSAFDGRLDEVALYRRALGAREVAAHWAAR